MAPNRLIRQQGSIYFWKYKTDGWLGSEWHFATSSRGRKFFSDLLDRMEKSDRTWRELIDLKPVTPTLARRPGLDLPVENRVGLRLLWQPSDSYYNAWSIRDNERIVDIEFGRWILREWRKAIQPSAQENVDRMIGLREDHTVFIW